MSKTNSKPSAEKEALSESVEVNGQMECEESVIDMIQRRRERGRAKYGQSMERDDFTILEWLTHAQEEALDLAIYLEALKRGIEVGAQRAAHRIRYDRRSQWDMSFMQAVIVNELASSVSDGSKRSDANGVSSK